MAVDMSAIERNRLRGSSVRRLQLAPYLQRWNSVVYFDSACLNCSKTQIKKFKSDFFVPEVM